MTDTPSNAILVYSTVWCSDCKRAKKFFGEQRIPYINIDIEHDPKGYGVRRAGQPRQAHRPDHHFSGWRYSG